MEVLRELLGMLAKREHTHHTAKREEKIKCWKESKGKRRQNRWNKK
jgi:hypothetical protein